VSERDAREKTAGERRRLARSAASA